MKSISLENIERRAREAIARQENAKELTSEISPPPHLADELTLELFPGSIENAPVKVKSRGVGRNLVKSAQVKINKAEQLGLFTAFPVTDRRAIPTLLARLPIFIPVPAKEQLSLLDEDLAYAFKTPFGRGRRFGPPVTTDDEDVLFSLMYLSEQRLIGRGDKLPIPLEDNEWMQDENGNLTVQVCIATVGQINDLLKLSRSGKNYKTTFASLKRLNHVSIELETKRKDLYLGDSWTGEQIRLIDIKWRAFADEGLIFAQFPPIMVKWLREQATFYSLAIRRKLPTLNARALHRFLSTQGNHYKQELTYIADAIEWAGSRQRLRPRIEEVMVLLRDEHNWCRFEITGTGRTTPFVLEMWRKKT